MLRLVISLKKASYKSERIIFMNVEKLYRDIQAYLDDHWLGEGSLEKTLAYDHICEQAQVFESSTQKSSSRSLEELVNNLDESFSQMLMRLIDDKKLTDVEAYKGAHLDRRLFSKIRSNKNYRPSKNTVLSFCIGLKLNLDEATDLLYSAGYSLSSSCKLDVIMLYFIENEIYDLFQINEALEAFEEKVLSV